MSSRRGILVASAVLVMACGLFAAVGLLVAELTGSLSATFAPTPDFAGTLQALIASSTSSPVLPTVAPSSSPDLPTGHIVLTCQLYKYQSSEQICIMNADGSGYRRLTTGDSVRHFYPSLAPDGASVVYSQYREDNVYEIYELNLATGAARRLTDRLGALTAPEISPDGKQIAFTRWTPASNQDQIWVMDRDGGNPHRVSDGAGWDPTWSPDGTRILFASDTQGSNQLYVIGLDGSAQQRISDLPALRGRSDWSNQGEIVTYSGASWGRELFLMNSDGSDPHQIGPSGGNSQGPTFSPDGDWIAFTAYFDHMNEINGCEIYIIRADGSNLRRLTNNDYCDYQPRWGP